MIVSTGYYAQDSIRISPGWFHLALVFYVPEHGFTLYRDEDSWTATILANKSFISNSSGVVILDRLYEDRDRNYGSLSIDELTFWNRQLSKAEVAKLRNMY